MIGYANAKQMPISSNFYTKGRKYGKPLWIIIHGTASGIQYKAEQTAADFGNAGWQSNRHASTHYVVGYDGVVVQCVDENDTAWGNGVISGPAGNAPIGGGNSNAPHDAYWDTAGQKDPNPLCISIEHSKSTDNSSALSPAQQAASFALVSDIVQRWGIRGAYANAIGGVTGHYSVDPINRAFCPGLYPWNELFNHLGTMALTTPVLPGNTLSTGLSAVPVLPPAQPSTGFSLGPIDISPVNNAYMQASDVSHQVLQSTPGFYGIVSAIDDALQFPGIYNATSGDTNSSDGTMNAVMSTLGTAAGNLPTAMFRLLLVTMGAILIIGLVLKVAEPLKPLGEVMK
jgi:N-acetyl-anhydromuramyl-L-alanine amidase AmpD